MMGSFSLTARVAVLSLFASGSACQSQPASTAPAAAAPIVARAAGVYVVIGPKVGEDRGEFIDEAMASPASGIYVRTLWSTIEPGPEAFDWSALDRDIAEARRHGKRISIGIRAGGGTPDWLLDRITTTEFVVGLRRGTRGHCQTLRYPIIWNKAYTDAYGRMMAAMAAHLKATGSYGDVTIVKLTGMNLRTEELHLPSEKPAERQIEAGTACRISDAAPIWQKAGYRPALALEAWKALAGGVGKAFPDKLLSLPIITSSDFPKMDADGQPVAKASARWVDVKQQIIGAGLRMFPGRFAVQWNSLNDKRMSPALAQAQREGAVIGLQSNFRRGPGGGAGCELTPKTPGQPCTAGGYRSMLAYGETAKATFLEIFPVDAGRFGPAIAESVKVLQSRK